MEGKHWTGTRVFFWGFDSRVRYGTVLEATRIADGTQVFSIKPDQGPQISLPAAGVTVVEEDSTSQPHA